MSFSLEKVVPWGRSFDEYVAMFALSEDDLERRIVGCGEGPASFNCTLTKQGGRIVSVDPIYQFSADEILRRIEESYSDVMEQTRKNAHEFIWQHIPSLEVLGHLRMAAMTEFLSDYPAGVKGSRYVAGGLPCLPFKDQTFELALCSHFLFLYSEQFSLEFHIQSIRELCRVATEVRIFPVLELGSRKSRHLVATLSRLQEVGLAVKVATVPYEFQKGGNQMLKVTTI
jgi:hypothetical protein